MKKVINLIKNPVFQRALVGGAVIGAGIYIAMDTMYNQGVTIGGNQVMDIAERMSPGFTEQFQKFVYAERLGWKS